MTEQERIQAALDELPGKDDFKNHVGHESADYLYVYGETIRDTLQKYAALLPLVGKVVEAGRVIDPGNYFIEGNNLDISAASHRGYYNLATASNSCGAEFIKTAANTATEMQKILEGETK